ncbi:MAG: NINE protein [bacterium]|nr:NINE protein [bacterium]
MNCPNCGASVPAGTTKCVKCGGAVPQEAPPQQGAQPQVVVQVQGGAAQGVAAEPGTKSKVVAGLLGIFLGGLGIHRFYLGFTGLGVAMLVLQIIGWVTSMICIGVFISIGVYVWGLIEGIMILVGGINTDAQGRSLV